MLTRCIITAYNNVGLKTCNNASQVDYDMSDQLNIFTYSKYVTALTTQSNMLLHSYEHNLLTFKADKD